MTDLTILIAVIALALWPLAFLVLRIRHERKKRRDRLDRMTKEDLEDIGTEELVIAVLKKIGCQPETNEEGHIVFKYQGDDFYIAVEDEARFIMIWNPWWASISMDNPALPYLKEIVNLVNVDSLVTTVFTADEDEKKRGASFQMSYGLYSQRRPIGRISESYARSFLCYSRCYQAKFAATG